MIFLLTTCWQAMELATMSDQQQGTPVTEEPQNTTPDAPQNNDPIEPDEPQQDERFGERLERLGGEPAPVITPEEFARLQRAGQVHIDARGRVRTTRRSDAEAGVSLKKRRAWY
jgi:hypothetical protein